MRHGNTRSKRYHPGVLALGIDIGTQSLKVVVLDERGTVLGAASVAYGVRHPRSAWAEQDADLWRKALASAVPDALQAAGRPGSEVECIGVAGQLDGCVAVDREGEPITPCLIWMDRRAVDQLVPLPEDFRGRTGLVPDASHMAAKVRWLKAEGGAGAGSRFHQPVSFLVEWLCGGFVYDHGLASTTMLYNLHDRDYDDALLESFAISREEMPGIAEAASVAGALRSPVASALGLRAGIPVAVGTGDDFATPLGAGIDAAGPMVCVLGTAEVVGAVAPAPVIDGEGLLETHGYPGGYFVENPGWLSGGAVTWARGLFGFASDREFDEAARAGSDGLLFLPALGGAMAPEWNPHARGAFYGLSSGHGAGHMARAILEGCAFAMKDVRDRLVGLDVSAEPIVLLGGGAHSDLWAQLRADLAGVAVEVPAELDTCPLGAGRLALQAVGQAPRSPDDPARKRFEPRREEGERMLRGYRRYRELFECLRPLYRPER
jgi:xylulokinase